MIALLFLACWIDAGNASHEVACGGQPLRLAPAAGGAAVDYKLKDASKERTGSVSLSLYASTRAARLRVGGVGSRKSPLFIEIPLAFYVRIRVSIVLPEPQPPPEDAPRPTPAGGTSASRQRGPQMGGA